MATGSLRRFRRTADFEEVQRVQRALRCRVEAADLRDLAVHDIDTRRPLGVCGEDIDDLPTDGDFAGLIDTVVRDIAQVCDHRCECHDIDGIADPQRRRCAVERGRGGIASRRRLAAENERDPLPFLFRLRHPQRMERGNPPARIGR